MTTITIPRTVVQQAMEFIEATNKSSSFRLVPDSNLNKTITALRAALAQPSPSQLLRDAGYTRRPTLKALQMREALELIAAPPRPDGTWNRDREACRQIASEALGRYDDE